MIPTEATLQHQQDELNAEIRKSFLEYDEEMTQRFDSSVSPIDIFTAGYLAAMFYCGVPLSNDEFK
jgi:hypothetical protein